MERDFGMMSERFASTIRLGAEPYLADHGFQGLTVLPGSVYVERALRAAASAGRPAGRVVRAEFHQPLILAAGETALDLQAEPLPEGVWRYSFREAPACAQASEDTPGEEDGARPSGGLGKVRVQSVAQPSPLATIEVGPAAGESPAGAVSLPTGVPVEGPQIYAQLRGNGNQYGPRFQSLQALWRSPGQVLARFELPAEPGDSPLHPVLLDTAVQVLGTTGWENGQTYVLSAIAAVDWAPGAPPRRGWVEATWDSAGSGGLSGEAVIYSEDGRAVVWVRGVQLRYLGVDADRGQTRSEVAFHPPELVVAASFTAEPIEPALQFWADTLGSPIRVAFAPYAQIFQELLTPTRRFRNNRTGLNVILLNLGDWITARPHADAPLDPGGIAEGPGGEPRFALPNGLKVAQLNQHETEYVYREIFEDQVYLRHGIHLSGAKQVIDIGANIGLFSLFVRSICPSAEVFSFEPSPVAFRALAANCQQYGPGLHPFNVGVSERRGSAPLTFYEKSSVFSSFHPDRTEDRSAIRAVVANLVQHELREGAAETDSLVDELMTDRMDSRTFDCPLVSVSDIIRDNRLQWIDLLKIDAEKCELEILRGIEDAHWPLIGQIVIEVHDATGAAVEEVKTILSRHGFRCAVEEEQFLTGSGLFNVYATRPGTPGPSLVADLQSKADQLVSALEGFAATVAAPVLLVLCPPQVRRGAESAALTLVEDELLRRVGALAGVSAVGSRALQARYPGTDWFNAQTDRLGHIPYSDSGFAALGETIFRTYAGLRRAPYKAIALDCDHTLWDGGVGEDGPQGVRVTPARRALQEFMVRQMRAGMMLCLCSKNAEEDVWAVFSQNPGMVLRRDQLTGARINWRPKSDNLRALADELGVGIESMIFVDDNPVECAEVRAHCPEVLVVELPAEADAAAARVDQVWAFDHLRVTAEDGRRTRMMQDGVRREAFRGQVATLADFIAGLELKVEVAPASPADYGRMAQLTQRTNQFNFTTVRRTENELRDFFGRAGRRGLTIKVHDRFGDYGLVGMMLYEALDDRYRVETFLLSCRVLGRGVEHAVLAALGQLAAADGKAWVELSVVETPKNLPARQFFQEVAEEGGGKIAARELAQLKFAPKSEPSSADEVERDLRARLDVIPRSGQNSDVARAQGDNALHPGSLPRTLNRAMVPDFPSAAALAAAVEQHRLRAAGFAPEASAVLPTDLTGQLLRLWRKTLGNPRIGLDDNFLDAGGTSLKAIQLVAAIRRELGRPVSVVTFFECPTVRTLSAKLEAPAEAAAPNRPVSAAMERGARRNQRLKRTVGRP
jgi:FkbH-like protein/FkbM family methyltransferase